MGFFSTTPISFYTLNGFSMIMNYDEYLLQEKRKSAWFRGQNFRGGNPCKVCGLYLCICQVSLLDFTEKRKPRIKEEKCPSCNLFLCDCPIDARGELIL